MEVGEQHLLNPWQSARSLRAGGQVGARVNEGRRVIAQNGVHAAGVFEPNQPVAQLAHAISVVLGLELWINVDKTSRFVDN